MSALGWTIPPIDAGAQAAARARQGCLTKPPGSLGMLEEVAIQLAGIQGEERPVSRAAAAILFAADHPVARRGVSAYPSEVTAAMVANFARGGAAASVASHALGVTLRVVDVGVAHPYQLPDGAGPVPVQVRRDPVADDDAGDLSIEDAMSPATFARAVAAGAAEIDALPGQTRVVLLGEMGIGNTTAAAAIATALLGGDPGTLTGAGTGVTGAALGVKRELVARAAARVRGEDAARVVQAVGGREIAALLGAVGRAAERRMAVLVDGFIVSAAVLALVRLCPAVRPYLLFAHRSREAGHTRVLEALDARPLLDLGLRLGEASGALAALPIVDLACALHAGMATFEAAGVPES